MSLVFAGVCSHAPGITGRASRADAVLRDAFYAQYWRMREAIQATQPDAIVVVAGEHSANFFVNNMPAYSIGMSDEYEGPIEDPEWLGIARTKVPGNAELSKRLIQSLLQDIDVAYAEEWRFDHSIMVPLHFLTPKYDVPIIPANINCHNPPLTPLHRAWLFGEALRRACDELPERIALVCTGGISHGPSAPDLGRINEAWDRDFMERWQANDKQRLLSYTDAEIDRNLGQGGLEIRTFIAAAAAARGGKGELWFYAPIPIFAVGCMVGVMNLN